MIWERLSAYQHASWEGPTAKRTPLRGADRRTHAYATCTLGLESRRGSHAHTILTEALPQQRRTVGLARGSVPSWREGFP